MFKRPNFIDWAIYKLFRWWWNPIFKRNPILTAEYIVEFFWRSDKETIELAVRISDGVARMRREKAEKKGTPDEPVDVPASKGG